MHYDNEIQTNCPVQFDFKKNKNNKKLVCWYLRCAYNHTLLFNKSKLTIYFGHGPFIAGHIPDWQSHEKNRIWPDDAFDFVNKRSRDGIKSESLTQSTTTSSHKQQKRH